MPDKKQPKQPQKPRIQYHDGKWTQAHKGNVKRTGDVRRSDNGKR